MTGTITETTPQQAPQCLIVDDSAVVRKVTRGFMEALGFAVAEAANGQEALNACTQAMPELILLDWNMPVMDGLEFLGRLRSDPTFQAPGVQPLVIFITTENDHAHIARALEAGANEYIMKPFTRDILHGKLASLGLLDEAMEADHVG